MSRPPFGSPWPLASTGVVVLLGWPARYSLSPVVHNAAFVEQGLDLVYVVAPTRPDDIDLVLPGLAAMGVIGANVTVPHKRAVMRWCDRLTEEADLVGAVNTLTWDADGLVGDNTDAVGFLDGLTAEVQVAGGDHLTMLGTGGASRAVAVACGRLGLQLTVVGRNLHQLGSVADLARRAGAVKVSAVELSEAASVRRAIASSRIVVNATPLGLAGEELPLAFHRLQSGQVAYDLVYTPPETPFLRSAAESGAAAHNGIGMFVGQAAGSYQRWTGQLAPVGVMSAAAVGVLTERARRERDSR